ncbi:hypothetical protein DU474_02495 [Campylobacter novaezeelandiae]|uniref:hypothetical protein n=1 Tax=Campylobacter novaezeelandiae TaxID=2267891 RepID=UPI001037E403|nr:hypothetical protein [Campylobacter novaezeelandiae]QWU80345.1 type IIS restriction/modification system, restriction endonuclease [Campylobacter novaezeelandiae]TBR80089.1 hypothetical protein DU474_02495 [Campylobacter novaezeelandiae]
MFEALKKDLKSINPALSCLEFLSSRIIRDDYRGIHKLQHYRWNLGYIKIVLKYLKKYDLLYHTAGDIRENYRYKDDELEFCNFLKMINDDLGKIGFSVTDMAMRKIIFVNLQRMGFLQRFDKNKKLCKVNKIYRNYRYVKISKKGLELLNSKNIFEEIKILGVALDRLFDGLVQSIFELINTLDENYLSIYEFMFFVSFLGKTINEEIINKEKIILFINEFRSLKARKKVVIETIKTFCDPKKFKGNKIDKRDFHNWKNQAQSIFEALGFMSIFEYDEKNEKIFLKTTLNKEKIKFKRSSLIKEQYFKEHKINKNISFELHHIVPFYFAKNLDMLKAIDDWRNLIYIDANSHKILTLDKDIKFAIRLSFDSDDVVLDNFRGFKFVLKKEQNVFYNKDLQIIMKDYNRSLL